MKFGVHFLLPGGEVPGSEDQTPAARYHSALEQSVLADGLGFESIWPAEQHGRPSQSLLSCPVVFLAAVAARTQNVRLGTAITQVPLSHPMRSAEEICTLDVISGGRAEFGVGRGTHPDHFAAFGARAEESRGRLEEGLAYLRAALPGAPFDFEGRYYRARKSRVVPAPIQQGGPPVRLAANSSDTFRLAGRLGLPVMTATHINPPSVLTGLLDEYRAARAAAGHPDATPDDITVLAPAFVATGTKAVEDAMAPAVRRYAALMRANLDAIIGRDPQKAPAFQRILDGLHRLDVAGMTRDRAAVFGTPDACLEMLGSLARDLGMGRFVAWFDFVGTTADRDVREAMEVFAELVAPGVL
ncbi:LLM class flavin-dependent oxidoreductase [Streptomyces sp. NPDC048514]|uniref:LLM class flavin-dependent oxidoreductase n=1 Tax=Streptomyces sp. NPDC048514 TaxID=3365564 RepID=UPI0037237BC9